MSPLLKRILLHGAITALVLAGIGVGFTQMAGVWMASSGGKPGEPRPVMTDELRLRIPLTMAFWGFVFVAGCELVLHRIRAGRPVVKPVEKQPDEAEKLLNELLAQAESKMAAEAEREKAPAGESKTAHSEPNPAGDQPKPQ
jgi:hypothetical protein